MILNPLEEVLIFLAKEAEEIQSLLVLLKRPEYHQQAYQDATINE